MTPATVHRKDLEGSGYAALLSTHGWTLVSAQDVFGPKCCVVAEVRGTTVGWVWRDGQ